MARFAELREVSVQALTTLRDQSLGADSQSEAAAQLARPEVFDAVPTELRREAADRLAQWLIRRDSKSRGVGPGEGDPNAYAAVLDAMAADRVFPYLGKERQRAAAELVLELARLGLAGAAPTGGRVPDQRVGVAALRALGAAARAAGDGSDVARGAAALLTQVARQPISGIEPTVRDRGWAETTAAAVHALPRALRAAKPAEEDLAEVAALLVRYARHEVGASAGEPGSEEDARVAGEAVLSLTSGCMYALGPHGHLAATQLLVDYARQRESAVRGNAAREESAFGALNAVDRLTQDDPFEELEMYLDESIVEQILEDVKGRSRKAALQGPGESPVEAGDSGMASSVDDEAVEEVVLRFHETLPNLAADGARCLSDYAAGRLTAFPGRPGHPFSLRATSLATAAMGKQRFLTRLGSAGCREVAETLLARIEGAFAAPVSEADDPVRAQILANAISALASEPVLAALSSEEQGRAARALAPLAIGEASPLPADPGHPEAARARSSAILILHKAEFLRALSQEALEGLADVLVRIALCELLLVPNDPQHHENQRAPDLAAIALKAVRDRGGVPVALEVRSATAIAQFNRRFAELERRAPERAASPTTRPEEAAAFAELERWSRAAIEKQLPPRELRAPTGLFVRYANPATPIERGDPRSPLSILGYRMALEAIAAHKNFEGMAEERRPEAAQLLRRWAEQEFHQALRREADEDLGRAVLASLVALGDEPVLRALRDDTERARAARAFLGYALGQRQILPQRGPLELNIKGTLIAMAWLSKGHAFRWLGSPELSILASLYVPYAEGAALVNPEHPTIEANSNARVVAVEALGRPEIFGALDRAGKARAAEALARYAIGEIRADATEHGVAASAQAVALAVTGFARTDAFAHLSPGLRARLVAALRGYARGKVSAIPGAPNHPFSAVARGQANFALKHSRKF